MHSGERRLSVISPLRRLALVVREDEVGAAAVEVAGGAELVTSPSPSNRVTARAADNEGGIPRGFRRGATAARAEVERHAEDGLLRTSGLRAAFEARCKIYVAR